jgi:hypothetical protein
MNTNTITQVTDILNNATPDEIDTITEVMSNMNVKKGNEKKTEKFAEDLLKKKNEKREVFVNFLESKSVNGLIYAPTQVGKSAATRIFIDTCFRNNTPVIVSTDNKTDQQEQLYSRIELDFIDSNVTMLKVSDKKFNENLKNCIQSKNKRFVIFALDNASQIEKLINQLTSCYTRCNDAMRDIKKMAIIHDEADTITKDNNTETINKEQAASHKKWLELRDLFNTQMSSIDLKRIFVTATPENCVMMYNIECPDVMRLEIPTFYTGYKSIEHVNYDYENDNIDILLHNEVNRIKSDETYEAILYCIDRKIEDGHEKVLYSLTRYLKCIINTYNGNGITTYMRTKKLSENFEKQLNKYDVKFTKNNKYYNMKDMTIRRFYSIVKKIGEHCVVTIGKDLICRGISYVGEEQKNPMTATTMFYRPGDTMHAVGICQTIGRITGCAMSNLPRRLYTPKNVYDTYMRYNKNQEKYMDKIEKSSDNKITKSIIEDMVFDKYERSIDRSKLKLHMNMVYSDDSDSESEDDSDSESEDDSDSESEDGSESEDEEDRMEELINMWWGKRTMMGKILSFVYESNGVNENDLKEFIRECGSKNIDRMYKELIRKDKDFTSVFERRNNITNLKQEAREYIDEM